MNFFIQLINRLRFFAPVLIIFSQLFCLDAKSQDKKLQLQFGNTLSIYAEKAFRSGGDKRFEAVGNVVIISSSETLYGEKASLDMEQGKVDIEGNVRVVSKDLTLYGSKVNYESQSGKLTLTNARVLSPKFNIIASSIKKTGDKQFEAVEAEFTTCSDCKESWSVYGDHIKVNLGEYVYITHALIKIKGVSIVYLPYIVLPIKSTRETGLLFPKFLSRRDEGLSYQQPFFLDISDSVDMSFTPSFWGKRGYGLDYEYRQVLTEDSWMHITSRALNDQIYLPGKHDLGLSDKSYSRGYTRFESHYEFSHNTNMHLRASGIKDLDMIGDFPIFFENELNEESVGIDGFFSHRFDLFNFSLEGEHKKTFFEAEAEKYNNNYVQVVPSIALTMSPVNIYRNESNFFNELSFSFDSDLTVFKQDQMDESINLRNYRRVSASPQFDLSVFSNEIFSHSLSFIHYYNDYVFTDEKERYFSKSASYAKNTFSFSLDSIFGLAYKEVIRASDLKEDSQIQNKKKDDSLLGAIPAFEDSLIQENIIVVKNSYRHAQEFNFTHHYTTDSKESGNERFLKQIGTNTGINDYDDLRVEDQGIVGSNISRTTIPKLNTFEFQWNNVLIKKSPKTENYFKDRMYIRDNFSYRKVGYLNLSQGYILDSENDLEDRLTRLYLNTGYNALSWSLNFKEYYFHANSKHMSALSFQKRFESLSFLSSYNLNSLSDNVLQTLTLGAQYRPIDILGLSYFETHDIEADENIITIFQVDIMPNNNCWILNLNYRDSVVDQRFSFNILVNFGNDEFSDFKSNYFSFNRDR